MLLGPRNQSQQPPPGREQTACRVTGARDGFVNRRPRDDRRNDPEGIRLRDVIVVLWRARLRISEALALTESDLDPSVARCWCAEARGQAARGRDGPLGVRAARAMAADPFAVTRRPVVLRSAQTDLWSTVPAGAAGAVAGSNPVPRFHEGQAHGGVFVA